MIRKITAADRADYIAMAKEFYRTDAVMAPVPEENILATFDEMMRSDEYVDAYIFEQDGKTVGFGLLAFTYSQEAGGRVVWIEEIYLREEYRGMGFGGGFIEYVKENVPAARYRLETEPENYRAQALYKRHGFDSLEYVNFVLEAGK